ncbi:MAG: hypothetical protein A4S14_02905 [Proteobacteria bacterium SG_bin9]|nr:MAG: hypothetical protein A4S14_02905 [Proteobacteria bacterium SG_bin9]
MVDDIQKRIDEVTWYHEFDFPGGYKARANTPDVADHHAIWKHIQKNLDQIDFTGKTVLDIGCWDGYWSFYSERRGAKHVLATDDASQNWAGSKGLMLARELLKSKVETNLAVSIYELEKLQTRFDIILCMGVYYHLVDPYYAFAQVRHLCHENTIVVFEGDTTDGLRPNSSYMDFTDPGLPIYVPGNDNLLMLLKAAYLEPKSQSFMVTYKPPRWKERVRMVLAGIKNEHPRLPGRMNRTVTVCKPYAGENELHPYRPPFGLKAYDPRFR